MYDPGRRPPAHRTTSKTSATRHSTRTRTASTDSFTRSTHATPLRMRSGSAITDLAQLGARRARADHSDRWETRERIGPRHCGRLKCRCPSPPLPPGPFPTPPRPAPPSPAGAPASPRPVRHPDSLPLPASDPTVSATTPCSPPWLTASRRCRRRAWIALSLSLSRPVRDPAAPSSLRNLSATFHRLFLTSLHSWSKVKHCLSAVRGLIGEDVEVEFLAPYHFVRLRTICERRVVSEA